MLNGWMRMRSELKLMSYTYSSVANEVLRVKVPKYVEPHKKTHSKETKLFTEWCQTISAIPSHDLNDLIYCSPRYLRYSFSDLYRWFRSEQVPVQGLYHIYQLISMHDSSTMHRNPPQERHKAIRHIFQLTDLNLLLIDKVRTGHPGLRSSTFTE